MTSLRHRPKVSGFFLEGGQSRITWNNLVFDLKLDFKDASCLVFGLKILTKDQDNKSASSFKSQVCVIAQKTI
jgi:hypothetical protein